jgi:hypothetical protein
MRVRWRELVDAEHAHTGFCQVIEGGSPNCAQANNERVVRGFFEHKVGVSYRAHVSTLLAGKDKGKSIDFSQGIDQR